MLGENLHLIEGLLLGHLSGDEVSHYVCVEASALVLIRRSLNDRSDSLWRRAWLFDDGCHVRDTRKLSRLAGGLPHIFLLWRRGFIRVLQYGYLRSGAPVLIPYVVGMEG